MKLRSLPPYNAERVPLRTVRSGLIFSPVSSPGDFLLKIHDGQGEGSLVDIAQCTVVWLTGPYVGEAELMGAGLLVVIPSKLAVTNEHE